MSNPAPTPSCACEGKNLDRFIQPIILHILAKGPHTGYAVVQAMPGYATFAASRPDPTGIYRYLRMMRQKGMITRQDDPNPASKNDGLFSITAEGRACLASWLATLETHAGTIHTLIGQLQG